MFLSFQANHSQSIRLCAQLFHFVSFVFGWTGLGLSARPYINMPVPWQLARKLPWKQGQSTVELSAWELKRHLRGQRISWEMPLRFSKAWNLLISVPGGLWVNGGVGIMKMKPKTYWTQIFTLGQGGAWPTRGNRGHARWDLVGSLTLYNGLFHFQLRSFMSMKLWEDGPFFVAAQWFWRDFVKQRFCHARRRQPKSKASEYISERVHISLLLERPCTPCRAYSWSLVVGCRAKRHP